MCGLWLPALIFCQMGGWCQSLKDCKTWAQVLTLYICLCGLKSGPTSIPWPLQFGLSISMDRNLIRLVPGPVSLGRISLTWAEPILQTCIAWIWPTLHGFVHHFKRLHLALGSLWVLFVKIRKDQSSDRILCENGQTQGRCLAWSSNLLGRFSGLLINLLEKGSSACFKFAFTLPEPHFPGCIWPSFCIENVEIGKWLVKYFSYLCRRFSPEHVQVVLCGSPGQWVLKYLPTIYSESWLLAGCHDGPSWFFQLCPK